MFINYNYSVREVSNIGKYSYNGKIEVGLNSTQMSLNLVATVVIRKSVSLSH